MKKIIKQTLLTLVILIGLSMLPMFTKTVHATESGLDKNAESAAQSTKGAAAGGQVVPKVVPKRKGCRKPPFLRCFRVE